MLRLFHIGLAGLLLAAGCMARSGAKVSTDAGHGVRLASDVTGAGTNAVTFTSFEDVRYEEGAGYVFVVPWFTAARSADPSQTKALNGSWSALFTEGIITNSYLKTTPFTVPPGTAAVAVSAWVNSGYSGGSFDVILTAGSTSSTSTWTFADSDVGSWSLKRAWMPVPQGATSFVAEIDLNNSNSRSANQQWMDNLSIEFIPQVPTVFQEALVADIGGGISGLALDSGNKSWSTSLGGMIKWAPAVANGVAFVTTVNPNQLAAVEVRRGNLVWKTTLPAPAPAGAVVSGESVLVCGSDGILRAYATQDGSAQWTVDAFTFGGSSVSVNGILLDAAQVYLSSDQGAAAVNVATRKRMWRSSTQVAMPYPGEVGNGLFFVGSKNSYFYAINSMGGTEWRYPTSGPVQSQPQFVNGGVIFGSDDGHIYVVQPDNGATISSLAIPGAAAVRSFLLEQGLLFVTGNAIGGELYAYRQLLGDNGQWNWSQSWAQAIPNGSQADPAVTGNAVIVTAGDKTVRAFDVQSGKPLWTSTASRVAFAGPATTFSPPALDMSRRFDRVCWLTSHNAYANGEDGWWYAQQVRRIRTQLDEGIRGLMLDIWNCPANTPDSLVYAHEGCSKSSWMLPFASWVRFADSLADIRAWLDRNPNEVLTIMLEQRADSRAEIWKAIDAAGFEPYFFYADRPNTGKNGTTWNVATQGWPSLAWMVAAGRRVVILSDWHYGVSPGKFNDGLPYIWDAAVENDYGNASRDGRCNSRSGSQPIAPGGPALFIQNYNTTISLNIPIDDFGLYTIFDRLNDSFAIISLVDGCWGLRNRLPNFIAVDWYDRGLNGGPFRAVSEVNKRWESQP